MNPLVQQLVDECKRQEESCCYTSTALFEWLKALRFWRLMFVVTPIVAGAFASWQLIADDPSFKWLTGIAALIAGTSPAIYKALDFDVSLEVVQSHANGFKVLQDRFRQAWRVAALGDSEAFRTAFDGLVTRMDELRAASPVAPERFFRRAQRKISGGDYDFAVNRGSSGS
jgi:hypothetical protein